VSGYVTQRIQAGDGTVVVLGREEDAPDNIRCWGASAWTKDDREEDAKHIGRLAADYTHSEMVFAVREYLRAHDTREELIP
jgi:hypothetical protein